MTDQPLRERLQTQAQHLDDVSFWQIPPDTTLNGPRGAVRHAAALLREAADALVALHDQREMTLAAKRNSDDEIATLRTAEDRS